MSNLSFSMFNQLNLVVSEIHRKHYHGVNKSSRYKIGVRVIAVVENNMLSHIIDFNKNRIIKTNQGNQSVTVSLASNESTLANDAMDAMTDAIKAVTSEHVLKAYEAANMLPHGWLTAKLEHIYKYTGRYVAVNA